MSQPLDFSSDAAVPCSVTIKATVHKAVMDLVIQQKNAQPKIAGKITRSSVMSLLIAEALEARNNAK